MAEKEYPRIRRRSSGSRGIGENPTAVIYLAIDQKDVAGVLRVLAREGASTVLVPEAADVLGVTWS